MVVVTPIINKIIGWLLCCVVSVVLCCCVLTHCVLRERPSNDIGDDINVDEKNSEMPKIRMHRTNN